MSEMIQVQLFQISWKYNKNFTADSVLTFFNLEKVFFKYFLFLEFVLKTQKHFFKFFFYNTMVTVYIYLKFKHSK